MPMFNQALFDLILGDTVSSTAISADSADYAHYVSVFQSETELQEPPPTDRDFFLATYDMYDRGRLYYAWYKMDGYSNATYLSRANAIVARYRDDYLLSPPGTFLFPHYQFLTGLALHYFATGNASDLTAIENNTTFNASICYPRMVVNPVLPNVDSSDSGSFDERIWARSLESFIVAHYCGIAPYGGISWATRAQNLMQAILNGQYPDGAWRSAAQSIGTFKALPWVVRPFYVGQVMDSLIAYYNLMDQNPNIITAIVAQCNYLLTAAPIPEPLAGGLATPLWQPGPNTNGSVTWYNSFKYLERSDWDENNSGSGYTTGAPDLNGLIINGFAFAYAKTGNVAWKNHANLMINGMRSANTYSLKQFCETYSYSYKAFPMLMSVPDGASPTASFAMTDVRDTMSITGRTGTKLRLNWV